MLPNPHPHSPLALALRRRLLLSICSEEFSAVRGPNIRQKWNIPLNPRVSFAAAAVALWFSWVLCTVQFKLLVAAIGAVWAMTSAWRRSQMRCVASWHVRSDQTQPHPWETPQNYQHSFFLQKMKVSIILSATITEYGCGSVIVLDVVLVIFWVTWVGVIWWEVAGARAVWRL